MEERNVIVIGSGPAGYTAAIYLARAKLKPLVLAGEKAGGQLMYTTEVENFPGFSKGINGPVLMEEMRQQALRFGAEILPVNVTKVDFSQEMKRVWVGEKEYQAKAVILTTGAKARMLKVGEEKLLGRGVSTCAVCDAAFFKDKTVFVVGGGDVAMEDALALTKFAKSVTIIHRREALKASQIMQERVIKEKQVPVLWNSEVVGVKGEQRLEGIRVKNMVTGEEQDLPAEGLFISIGHIPETDFLKDSRLVVDDHMYLKTNLTSKEAVVAEKVWLEGYPTQTNIAGVFAAGDVVDFKYRQAVTAAGMGTMAALDAEKFLTGSMQSW